MKGKCILIFMIVLAMGMTACSAVSTETAEEDGKVSLEGEKNVLAYLAGGECRS
ncbi:hypothetical protein IMSAGC002_01484 [Lachnospiraceae bacterium]|jgi:hypothetical protein|nr:hypothetical protein IMSAGC002_01484 [Lachnospiraceae bacterium]